MIRKICIVTGTRAEYGLLRFVMEEVRRAQNLSLQVVVTGMHLSPEFGSTWREVEADGFTIDRKVEMLLGEDTPSAITKSMGLGLIGFADALAELTPDLIIVLGDRFEILVAASAALVARVPIAHIHGGEITEGAFDDAIRHAITKMAHLHFVAAEEYRRRVLQLGEESGRVFLVGALGIDAIRHLPLLSRDEVERRLDFRLGERNLLVTFHPETLSGRPAGDDVAELLGTLATLVDTRLIFTLPNADPGNRDIRSQIEAFVETRPDAARAYASLGQLLYLSCLRQMDGVVGNSSSGLLEAPFLGKGTVNIGDRQRGRLRTPSVLDCAPERGAIREAIATLYRPEFQAKLQSASNMYGDGTAGERIVTILRDMPFDTLLKKQFTDFQVVRQVW